MSCWTPWVGGWVGGSAYLAVEFVALGENHGFGGHVDTNGEGLSCEEAFEEAIGGWVGAWVV